MTFVQRDYILRIIEQAVQAVLYVIGLQRHGEYVQAVAAVEREAGQLLGLDLARLRSMDEEDALEYLYRVRLMLPSASDAEWWVTALVLLEEAAALYRRQGPDDDAARIERLALPIVAQIPVDDRAGDTISSLVSSFDPAEDLSVGVWTALWLYNERAGDYARAEDWLFELLESGSYTEATVQRGVAFYWRLEELSTTDLARGGLPLSEIREGIEQLRIIAAEDRQNGTRSAR